jgi:hypothetical protein
MTSKKDLQERIEQIDATLEILGELRAALVSEIEALKEV